MLPLFGKGIVIYVTLRYDYWIKCPNMYNLCILMGNSKISKSFVMQLPFSFYETQVNRHQTFGLIFPSFPVHFRFAKSKINQRDAVVDVKLLTVRQVQSPPLTDRQTGLTAEVPEVDATGEFSVPHQCLRPWKAIEPPVTLWEMFPPFHIYFPKNII